MTQEQAAVLIELAHIGILLLGIIAIGGAIRTIRGKP